MSAFSVLSLFFYHYFFLYKIGIVNIYYFKFSLLMKRQYIILLYIINYQAKLEPLSD